MALWFTAQYHGRCVGCGSKVEPGDLITKHNHEVFGECCSEDIKEEEQLDDSEPNTLRAGETICDRCRLVRPCSCCRVYGPRANAPGEADERLAGRRRPRSREPS